MTKVVIPAPRRFNGPRGQLDRGLHQAVAETANVLTRTPGLDEAGDLSDVGGHRQMAGPFIRLGTPASATNQFRLGNATGVTKWVPWRAGSIVGLAISLDTAAAGEDLRVELVKTGVVIDTLYVAIDKKKAQRTYRKDLFQFRVDEDEIQIQVVTTAAWTATGAVATAWLEVEM